MPSGFVLVPMFFFLHYKPTNNVVGPSVFVEKNLCRVMSLDAHMGPEQWKIEYINDVNGGTFYGLNIVHLLVVMGGKYRDELM